MTVFVAPGHIWNFQKIVVTKKNHKSILINYISLYCLMYSICFSFWRVDCCCLLMIKLSMILMFLFICFLWTICQSWFFFHERFTRICLNFFLFIYLLYQHTVFFSSRTGQHYKIVRMAKIIVKASIQSFPQRTEQRGYQVISVLKP